MLVSWNQCSGADRLIDFCVIRINAVVLLYLISNFRCNSYSYKPCKVILHSPSCSIIQTIRISEPPRSQAVQIIHALLYVHLVYSGSHAVAAHNCMRTKVKGSKRDPSRGIFTTLIYMLPILRNFHNTHIFTTNLSVKKIKNTIRKAS